MKASLLTLGAFAAAGLAQNVGDLPTCGQTCATNMLSDSKAAELDCKQKDIRCLCLNKNFFYGLRDCSQAICDDSGAEQVVAWGLNICDSAGVQVTTGSDDAPTVTATTSSDNSNMTPGADQTTSSSSDSEEVSTVFSTMIADGTTMTTPISTIIGGVGGKISSKVDDVSSKVDSVSDAVSSAVDSVSSKVADTTETVTDATETVTDATETVTSDGGEPTESGDNSGDDEGAAPALVAGPAALVAAAVAALLF